MTKETELIGNEEEHLRPTPTPTLASQDFRVLDLDTYPISGARVCVGDVCGTTDAGGNVTLDNLPFPYLQTAKAMKAGYICNPDFCDRCSYGGMVCEEDFYCCDPTLIHLVLMAIPKSVFHGTIDVPNILPSQSVGDKPLICKSVTWKNTGEGYGMCYMHIYEANSDGSEKQATPLTSLYAMLDINEVEIKTDLYAQIGLSANYPEGSTLYICFKTWGEGEPKPSCSASVAVPVGNKLSQQYIIKP